MPSPTIENYLKALFSLANPEGEVSATDLAQSLEVSLPSVNSMVKKLAELGYLEYEKYKPLKITDLGKKDAALIIRKHRLTEMFLVVKMGFGWEEVHPIAEQIEHIDSPLFFDRMDALLGFPQVDPHGSPIPDKLGNMAIPNLKKLAECRAGEHFTLLALQHSSNDFLLYLNKKEITLGAEFHILGVEEFDKSMTVNYGNRKNEVFSTFVCHNLLGK
jgi:DtxR family Mn-dependent transcriptional regulator